MDPNLKRVCKDADEHNACQDRWGEPRQYPTGNQIATRFHRAYRNPGYKAIVDEARRLDWPLAFHVDLYLHDCENVSKLGNQPFVWAIRPGGTWILSIDKTAEEAKEAIKLFCRLGVDNDQRWYVWDNHELRFIGTQSYETATQLTQIAESLKEEKCIHETRSGSLHVSPASA